MDLDYEERAKQLRSKGCGSRQDDTSTVARGSDSCEGWAGGRCRRYSPHGVEGARDVIVAVALFDLDNALLADDSEQAWCEFLIGIGVLDGDGFRAENERLYKEYLAGTLNIYDSVKFQLKL